MKTLMGHAAIVTALAVLTLLTLDSVNRAMNFIDNGLTKFLLAALALLAIGNGCLTAGRERRRVRRELEKKKRAAEKKRAAKTKRQPRPAGSRQAV